MSVDILGISWGQCVSKVQYSFTSTETRRLVRADSPGRPPRLSHSSWTMILHEWLAYFIARFFFFISTEVVYLQRWHGWCLMTLLPSRRVLCTPYNHAPYHFMQSHIREVHACLAVTCHLHFWQSDRGLLRATAVTRGWNGYRNRSQHRKSTLENKIPPPLPQGFEPATFQSRVRRSNH